MEYTRIAFEEQVHVILICGTSCVHLNVLVRNPEGVRSEIGT
jgi:methylmalonyl-CoA mutase cobalamin-binding subunit